MVYIKRKRSKKSAGRKFFYVVFVVIVIYILGYFISFFMQKKIDSTVIEYADCDNSKIISGIVVRDEKTYTAKKSGLLSINLHNNDVAKRNSVVCAIQDKNSVSKLESELSQINNDILVMQKNRIGISLFQTDIKNANGQIEKIIDENIYACPQNNFSKINNLMDYVQKNLDLKNQLLLTENRGNIKDMDSKKKSIEQQIKKNIDSMIAKQSGIVSYLIDDLENTFTVNKINELRAEQIDIKSQTKEFLQNSPVNKGDVVFKIIESNNWYIVCLVKNKDIENLAENDFKLIFLETENGFVNLETCVQKILTRNKNESLLILKATKSVQDFIAVRNIKFKLEDTSCHGFKIPVSAVIRKKLFKIPPEFISKDKMVTKKNNETVQIKIYDSDENYFYVDSEKLNFNDIIVANGKSFELNQIKKIRGIYIANTGIAEFRKINYSDDLSDDSFIIVEPKVNPHIKIYDRIVTNAAKISDGQKIIEH